MYEPILARETRLREAAERLTKERGGPLLQLHYITCDCEGCQAVREEKKENNGKE